MRITIQAIEILEDLEVDLDQLRNIIYDNISQQGDDPVSIENEAADLIFHLQVALKHHDVHWRDVLQVLKNRRRSRQSQ